MSDPLTFNSDKEAILGRVSHLISTGITLKAACEQIEQESGQKAATTKKQYQRSDTAAAKRHGHCKLTQEQEGILLSILVVYSLMHEALKPSDIANHVQATFGIEVGKNWAYSFVKRHTDVIRQRKTKLLASKQVDGTIYKHVAEFIGQVQTVEEVYPMKPTNVCNYDETRVYVGDEGGILLEHVSKECGQKRGIKGRTVGLLVSFVSASGSILMSVWIFKASSVSEENDDCLLDAKFHVESQSRNLRGSWKRFYAFTASGYSNRELHGKIMAEFGKIWVDEHPTDYCWLFGDQLAAHKCPQTVEKCLEQRVMSWLLPANTSHFLQPLDDKIFANFKQKLRTSGEKIAVGHTLSPDELAVALYHAGYEAERSTFTERVIKRAFENTGLWPFNPDRILELTENNMGKIDGDSKSKHVASMERSVEHKFQSSAKKPALKKGTAKVQASTLFSPFELVAAEYLTKLEKERKAQIKREAAQMKKEESAAKRAARTCGVGDCATYSRKDGGAMGWSKCEECRMIFCKKNKAEFVVHVAECKKDDEDNGSLDGLEV